MYIFNTWKSSLSSASEQALNKAKISAIALSGEMIKDLRAVPEDVGTIPYNSIKNRLIALKAITTNVDFLYFYTQRDGKLYFMVDSEPEESKDIAPAGMEYIVTGTEYSKPFINGEPIITKPSTDEWGTWISALVPIKDPQTGKVLEVFAMDYPADIWDMQAFNDTLQSSIIILILFLLILTFYGILKSIFRAKESEEKYKLLINNSQDIIYTLDMDGRFTFVSPAWTFLLGHNINQVIGKSVHEFIHEDDIIGFTDFFNKVINTTEERGNFTYRFKHIDGSWHWYESDMVALTENNMVTGCYGIARDIADQKKKLDEINQLNKYMVGRELKMVQLKKQINQAQKNDRK
jgi:PAS domain S-box-containing protein